MESSRIYSSQEIPALICGFRFKAGQEAERLEWLQVAEPGTDLQMTWLHFDLVDVRACDWIAACSVLPDRARDILLSSDEYVRFESVGRGIAAVIGDFDHDLHTRNDTMGVFRLYVDGNLMVTARRHPLKGTDRLRRDILDGAMIDSPIKAFAYLLVHVASSFGTVTAELDRRIDRIEDRLLGGNFRDEGRELGRARRTLAGLRRHAGSQRHADGRGIVPEGCSEEEAYQMRRSIEALYAITQDIEGLQVRSRLLQDEMANRISEETNRNIYFLSIFAAVFLPITIVAGIFGMNVGGIPWEHDPAGFGNVMLLTVATVILTLVLLKWRKLI